MVLLTDCCEIIPYPFEDFYALLDARKRRWYNRGQLLDFILRQIVISINVPLAPSVTRILVLESISLARSD